MLVKSRMATITTSEPTRSISPLAARRLPLHGASKVPRTVAIGLLAASQIPCGQYSGPHRRWPATSPRPEGEIVWASRESSSLSPTRCKCGLMARTSPTLPPHYMSAITVRAATTRPSPRPCSKGESGHEQRCVYRFGLGQIRSQ